MRLLLSLSLVVLVMLMSSCSTNENDPIDPGTGGGDPITLPVTD